MILIVNHSVNGGRTWLLRADELEDCIRLDRFSNSSDSSRR